MTMRDREQLGEWLSAYLDGELSEQESRQVEQFVRENADAQQLLEELRSTIHAVASLPRHRAPASLADDIQSNIERAALIGEIGTPPTPSKAHSSPLRGILSLAAALVLVVSGWWFVYYDPDPSAPKEQLALATREVEEKSIAPRAKRLDPAPAAKSAARLDGDANNVILASADFEQKRKAGLGTDAVRTHAFKNETVRLQITVKDAKQREAVTARVLSYLKNERLADLEKGETKAEEFLFEGLPQKNYEDRDEQQVLVRASKDKMDGLLNTIEASRNQNYRVAFASGPLSVHGWEGTRMAVSSLGEPARVETETDDAPNSSVVAASQDSSDALKFALADRKGKDPIDSIFRTISSITGDASEPSAAGQDSSEADTWTTDSDKGSVGNAKMQQVASASPENAHEKSSTKMNAVMRSDEETGDEQGGTESLEGRSSLVSRRIKALEEKKKHKDKSAGEPATKRTTRRRTRRPSSPADMYTVPMINQPSMELSVDSFITFVVEVKLDKPKTRSPKKTPRFR